MCTPDCQDLTRQDHMEVGVRGELGVSVEALEVELVLTLSSSSSSSSHSSHLPFIRDCVILSLSLLPLDGAKNNLG